MALKIFLREAERRVKVVIEAALSMEGPMASLDFGPQTLDGLAP